MTDQVLLKHVYLNNNSSAFIHCDHGVVVDPSEHLQGWTVAPFQHIYTEAVTQMLLTALQFK